MTATIPDLTTPRLILRRLELADADAVQRLFPQIEVVRFLASRVPWPYPTDGAFTFLRDVVLPGMARGTEWHWSIRPKTAPEQLIGMINVRDSSDDNRGFWLDPVWHGQGLMTEASIAVTDFWFDTLERPVLRVIKAIANNASRRISEAAGMRVIATEDRDYVSGRWPSEIWEMTAEEWRSRRPPQ
ncbi:GNAT family N-acetyltransferase [Tardiphaga sp.]|uniref:GNAT family N-acetyltransferase n=1 Tax=Tardiphaga sp. TaxID=1926292 RepID=UPI00352B598D